MTLFPSIGKHAELQLIAIGALVMLKAVEAVVASSVRGRRTPASINPCKHNWSDLCSAAKRSPHRNLRVKSTVAGWEIHKSTIEYQHSYATVARIPFSRIAASGWSLLSAYVGSLATRCSAPLDDIAWRCTACALSFVTRRLASYRTPISLMAITLMNTTDPPTSKPMRSTENTRSEQQGTSPQAADSGDQKSNKAKRKSTAPLVALDDDSGGPRTKKKSKQQTEVRKPRALHLSESEEDDGLPPAPESTKLGPAMTKNMSPTAPPLHQAAVADTSSASASSRPSRAAAAKAAKALEESLNDGGPPAEDDDSDFDGGKKAETSEDEHSDDDIERLDVQFELDDSNDKRQDPGPSTSKSKQPPAKQRSGKKKERRSKTRHCQLCRYNMKSDEEAVKHQRLTNHQEATYKLCDFPGCNQLYCRHYDMHMRAHYGETLVCGYENEDGTSCKFTSMCCAVMIQHRKRPHDGKYHCVECNWFIGTKNGYDRHEADHNLIIKKGTTRTLQHISTYNGSGTVIPIRGLEENHCPVCALKMACLSHFLWHWKEVHTQSENSKDECAGTVHIRCDLCGLCMPVSYANMHKEFNCLYTVFPQIHQAIGDRDDNEDGVDMSLCECRAMPNKPRRFNGRLMHLSETMEKEHVPAKIESIKCNVLVKRFLDDNVNAGRDGSTYAIVNVDPQKVYTLSEFLHRIQYIGSSTRVNRRDQLPSLCVPTTDHGIDEVQYRIRLGTTIEGKDIWQFNKCDVEMLETFVILYLSLPNLWNRAYPLSAQGCLLNDRFRKYVAVFDAISTVVLYGAYEEIVAQRNWDDWRVTIFKASLNMVWLGKQQFRIKPPEHNPAPAPALNAAVPLVRMSSQEAYARFLETAELSGKRPEDLLAGLRARLYNKVDHKEQTDDGLGPVQAHVGCNASPESTADNPYEPESYEDEEIRIFPQKQEKLQEQLREHFRASPIRSAYVKMKIPRPSPRRPGNLNDGYISESASGTPANKPPTPRNAISPDTTPLIAKPRGEVEKPTPGCWLKDAPTTNIRTLESVCTDATTDSDGPQSAKSNDSGVGLEFDFDGAVHSDAIQPSTDDDARFESIYSKKGILVRKIDMLADPLPLSGDSSSSDSDSDSSPPLPSTHLKQLALLRHPLP